MEDSFTTKTHISCNSVHLCSVVVASLILGLTFLSGKKGLVNQVEFLGLVHAFGTSVT